MVNKVSVFDVSIYSHRYPMFHILHCFTLFHSITGGPGFPLGLCEGDCDDDSECQVCLLQSMRSYFYSTLHISSFLFVSCFIHIPLQSPLRCFERNGYDPVPGCEGDGSQGSDYCTMRIPENLLWDKSNNLGTGQYGKCEGDCDRSSDCIGDLVCFKRSQGSLESIPGCAGQGQPGDDYCYDPNDR